MQTDTDINAYVAKIYFYLFLLLKIGNKRKDFTAENINIWNK